VVKIQKKTTKSEIRPGNRRELKTNYGRFRFL